MADIFLSYAREDQSRVGPLVQALEGQGWSVFWDRRIPAGQTWRSHIGEALDRARCVIVAWSRDAIASDWVIEEADVARRRGILVPILLDPVEPPMGLHAVQAADLTGWDADPAAPRFRQLLDDIRAVLLTAPATVPPPLRMGESAPPRTALAAGDRAEAEEIGSAIETLPGALAAAIAARQRDLSARPAGEPRSAAPRALPCSARGLATILLLGAACALGLLLALKYGFHLLAFLTSTRDPFSPRSKKDRGKTYPVDCSVFSPGEIAVGQTILLQVYAHPPRLSSRAETAALAFDESAVPRGFASLDLDLAEGERIGFELIAPDLIVSDDGVGEIRWYNRVRGLQFQVTAPSDCPPGPRHVTLRVFVQGAPAGRIHFVIEVSERVSGSVDPQAQGDWARRYRKAFISYASPDRNEALKRVQILSLLGVEYFQDLLSLDPGQRWERALYEEIGECDLFLLFWSSAARDSEWVRKEVVHAIECRKNSQSGDPDILPVIIEGPPPVPPPPELEGLHFNDKLIYFMRP